MFLKQFRDMFPYLCDMFVFSRRQKFNEYMGENHHGHLEYPLNSLQVVIGIA